jgi:arsenate reductase (thioredoxin)
VAESFKERVLVLCTGNSCRSQMAEGWLNALYGDRVEAYSAGHAPARTVHPFTIAVMQEVGVDLSGAQPKHMNDFITQSFDKVLTVCDPAKDACPVFPGKAERLHRTFYDPAWARGTKEQRLDEFRRIRDEIRVWVDEIFGGV